MSRDGLPHFLVLGVPKAGTTSFHHYLAHHPELFLPARKEVHHFTHPELARNVAGPGDRRVAAGACSSPAAYLELFRGARPGQLRGEVSPSYFYFRESYERIRTTLGADVKLLVLFRNPVDRAFSNYLHVWRSGRETLSFGDALDAEHRRIAEGYGDFWRYQDHSRYSDRLADLLRTFGEDAVLPLSFHELTADPVAVVQRACRFLGIDDTYEPPNTGHVYNAGNRSRTGRFATWFVKPSRLKDIGKRVVPGATVDRLRAGRDRLLSGGGPVPAMDPESYERLRTTLGGEVELLRDRHGLDLSGSRYRPEPAAEEQTTRRWVP